MIICCVVVLFWSSVWCPGGFLYLKGIDFSRFGKFFVIILLNIL
jgi:hypothetical protein